MIGGKKNTDNELADDEAQRGTESSAMNYLRNAECESL
jgi:hypothetical protein